MSEEEVPAGPPAWPGGATFERPVGRRRMDAAAADARMVAAAVLHVRAAAATEAHVAAASWSACLLVIFVFAASAAATAVIATRGIGGSGSNAGVEAAVVDIDTTLGDGAAAAGTGIVLTSSGVVLTNNHVVEGRQAISVRLTSTGATYPAVLIGEDTTHDIAVLQLEGASGLATAPIGDSSTVQVGDSVTALGNAEGRGGAPAVAPGR